MPMNDPTAPVNDMLTVRAPAAQPTTGNSDPNRWKPRVTEKFREYGAIVRQLPQGLEGLAKNLYPSVKVRMHYLTNKPTGIRKTIICAATRPGQTCPICTYYSTLYNNIKESKGEDAAKNACRGVWAQSLWYTNVLIRQDAAHPENNGTVKVWPHSDAVERKLHDPCEPEPQQAFNPNSIAKKPKRCFIPYSPRDGVDFIMQAAWDTEKNMCSYDGSYWDDKNTPLAGTDQEMLALLDQCHDLTKYVNETPTEEECNRVFQEYLASVDAATRNVGIPGANSYGSANVQYSAPAPQAAPARQQYAAPASTVQTNTIDPNAFFGNAAPAQQAPAAQVAPAPVFQQPVAPDPLAVPGQQQQFAQAAFQQPAPQQQAQQLPPSSDDDDDLPF